MRGDARTSVPGGWGILHIRTCNYMYIRVYVYICVYACVYICVYTMNSRWPTCARFLMAGVFCTYTRVVIYIYICVCIYMCVCMCICIYVYILRMHGDVRASTPYWQCVAVWCSVLQCDAVWCSVMQRDAVWCSVLHHCWLEYGVATVSRIDKIIELFCRILSLL